MKRYIKAADRGDGLIGIWWYLEDQDQVIGQSEPVDNGDLDGLYIQPSKGNHLQLWKQYAPDAFYSQGFKSLYRGRVIYNTQTQCYEITCSEDLLNDQNFRNAIIEFYQLSQCRRQFVPLHHYKAKMKLTGNPAVDSTYFDF